MSSFMYTQRGNKNTLDKTIRLNRSTTCIQPLYIYERRSFGILSQWKFLWGQLNLYDRATKRKS